MGPHWDMIQGAVRNSAPVSKEWCTVGGGSLRHHHVRTTPPVIFGLPGLLSSFTPRLLAPFQCQEHPSGFWTIRRYGTVSWCPCGAWTPLYTMCTHMNMYEYVQYIYNSIYIHIPLYIIIYIFYIWLYIYYIFMCHTNLLYVTRPVNMLWSLDWGLLWWYWRTGAYVYRGRPLPGHAGRVWWLAIWTDSLQREKFVNTPEHHIHCKVHYCN